MLSRTTRRERAGRSGGRRRTTEGLPRTVRTTEGTVSAGAEPERRDFDRSQDTAVYNCQCGMVFEAQVCTSVGCPHCGTSQAW